MSFLNVAGKIYYCFQCKSTTRVCFAGGPQLTQIGDLNVFEQMEISRQLGQPNSDPEREGYYLYDLVLCEKCYQQYLQKNEEMEKAIQPIVLEFSKLINEKHRLIGSLVPELNEMIAKQVNCFALESLDELLGERFDKDLGDKHALPGKKRGKFNQLFTQSIRHKAIPYFLKKALAEEKIEQPVSSYLKQVETAWVEPTRKFRDEVVQTYIPFAIRRAENLNNYVCYEATVRAPEATTPDLIVYHECELDFAHMNRQLALTAEDFEKEFVCSQLIPVLKERLEKLLFA